MDACRVVGFELGTGAIRMGKPLILRRHYVMGEFFRMHVDQKSACRRCYNDMFLSVDAVLGRAAFLQIRGLPS